MPNDKAAREAQKRGIRKIVTIHPDKHNPKLYMHVYVVNKAGKRGGHTVRGEIKRKVG